MGSIPPPDEEPFLGDFAWFGEAGEPLPYRAGITDWIAAELAGKGSRCRRTSSR